MTLLSAQAELLEVAAAASRAGVRPATVRSWINRGLLASIVVDGRVLVGDRDVVDCERQRRRSGRRRSGGARGRGSAGGAR